jgi:hypothetical protein
MRPSKSPGLTRHEECTQKRTRQGVQGDYAIASPERQSIPSQLQPRDLSIHSLIVIDPPSNQSVRNGQFLRRQIIGTAMIESSATFPAELAPVVLIQLALRNGWGL